MDIGKVYKRLILGIAREKGISVIDALVEAYASGVSDKIDDYNSSLYWLLGDRTALQQAYPDVADRIASKHAGYQQDSICGTWECLAEMLTKGGIAGFKKKNPSAHDVGRKKSEWAKNIGSRMDIRCNASPSFQVFLRELDKRVLEK